MRQQGAVADGHEFDPRVSLALEKILVERDYFVLASMLRDDPKRLEEGLKKLEKMIAVNHATESLDKLSAHCDRRALLWLLHPFSRGRVFRDALWSNKPGPGSIEALLGISARELGCLTKKLNEVAELLDIVYEEAEFSSLLKLSKQLYPVWRLPRTLRICTGVLQYAAKHFAGNTHIYQTIAKARLTSYVLEKVESSYAQPSKKKRREFHDEQIVDLISAVSDDKDKRYDSSAHRMWRQKHYQRLRLLDPNVEQRLFLAMSPTSNPMH